MDGNNNVYILLGSEVELGLIGFVLVGNNGILWIIRDGNTH